MALSVEQLGMIIRVERKHRKTNKYFVRPLKLWKLRRRFESKSDTQLVSNLDSTRPNEILQGVSLKQFNKEEQFKGVQQDGPARTRESAASISAFSQRPKKKEESATACINRLKEQYRSVAGIDVDQMAHEYRGTIEQWNSRGFEKFIGEQVHNLFRPNGDKPHD